MFRAHLGITYCKTSKRRREFLYSLPVKGLNDYMKWEIQDLEYHGKQFHDSGARNTV